MYKTRKFYEIRGKFGKVGGMKDFSEMGGKWNENTIIEGENFKFVNLWVMTKKGHQNFFLKRPNLEILDGVREIFRK